MNHASLFALPPILLLQIQPSVLRKMRFGRANTRAALLPSTTELTHPVCHLSIMTLWIVWHSVPPLSLSPHSATQSVIQPNPIKWLLMNFKQVLSPSSTCAMLHFPPAPSMRALTLSALFLFNLFPSASLTGWRFPRRTYLIFIFCVFSSDSLFLSVILRVLLYPPLCGINMKQFRGVLFPIYYLFPPLIPLLTFPCLSVTLLFLSLLFTCSFSSLPFSSSWRQVIGALYAASSSHLNWLALNIRPPIAERLVSSSLWR